MTAAAGTARLSLVDVRSLVGERLGGRPTRANFRTGDLTMCTMVPMRSVPHRVVCVLGLDDGVFPRTPGVDGDDVSGAFGPYQLFFLAADRLESELRDGGRAAGVFPRLNDQRGRSDVGERFYGAAHHRRKLV